MGYWNEGLRLGPNPSFFAWFNNFHAIGVQHFCLNKKSATNDIKRSHIFGGGGISYQTFYLLILWRLLCGFIQVW